MSESNKPKPRPPKKVYHADLQRYDSESIFRSKCPDCPNGILTVQRDYVSMAVVNLDTCTQCGQQFVYRDKYIGGSPVADVVGKKS